MRYKKYEQRLIRAITLLDDAEAGREKENILYLLHGARRACRSRDYYVASQYGYEARMMLRALTRRREASGAPPEAIELIASATDQLRPDFVMQVQAIFATFMSASPVWRLVVLGIPFILFVLACWPWLQAGE
ncbi:hypothetical protein [Erwinia aphidicola]|uniref:hypothetical protein n=1 Tax=Erwinia aphidicola TaxID=68334 RepID=UPI003019A994